MEHRQYNLQSSFTSFVSRAMHWASQYTCAVFLRSHGHRLRQGTFPDMLAVGNPGFSADKKDGNPWNRFKSYYGQHQSTWQFGFLSYELKNHLECLSSTNPEFFDFPLIGFFNPDVRIYFNESLKSISIYSDNPEAIWARIHATPPLAPLPALQPGIMPLFDRDQYLDKAERLRTHIRWGDVYEVNLCIPYLFQLDRLPQPVTLFNQLGKMAPAPFSAWMKWGNLHAFCASPERFIKKSGATVYSQPMKGTIARNPDPEVDAQLARKLLHNEKERAENMMIVDLVRNDLAKSAIPGTVRVEELFGIQSFTHVHQMVSTITATARPDAQITDIIGHAFPMGSMTGAPKIKAMQLIDHYEEMQRDLFSGTIGYITPEGDFDFNVVIRTLFYHEETGTAGFQVGSAITYDANPETEWEECQLKAKGIKNLFSQANRPDILSFSS